MQRAEKQMAYDKAGKHMTATIRIKELWKGTGKRPSWYKRFGLPFTQSKVDEKISDALDIQGSIYLSGLQKKLFGPKINDDDINELIQVIVKKPNESLAMSSKKRSSSSRSSGEASGSPKEKIDLEEEAALQEQMLNDYNRDSRELFYKLAPMSVEEMINEYPQHKRAILKKVKELTNDGKTEKEIKSDIEFLLRDRIIGKLLF